MATYLPNPALGGVCNHSPHLPPHYRTNSVKWPRGIRVNGGPRPLLLLVYKTNYPSSPPRSSPLLSLSSVFTESSHGATHHHHGTNNTPLLLFLLRSANNNLYRLPVCGGARRLPSTTTTYVRAGGGMGRSPCCEKAHTNKGAWTKEEDQRLIAYIKAHGEGCWRSLPKAAGIYLCIYILVCIENKRPTSTTGRLWRQAGNGDE